jgi:hypothetical protein
MNFGGSLCDGRGLGRRLRCFRGGNFIWRGAWDIRGRPHNPVRGDAYQDRGEYDREKPYPS